MTIAYVSFAVALLLGLVDWLAVARGNKRLEYVFKPATLVAILVGAGLLMRGPHDTWQARFFLPGLALSLAGDVFLMLPGERFFLPGLVSFLLGHVCYIFGLNPTLPPRCGPVFFLLVVVVALGAMIYRPIAAGLRNQGRTSLILPVAVYTTVISLMLLSAWVTLFRPEWTPLRRGLVIAGASLFMASDGMLAFDRFVRPLPSAALRVMVTYHLGQMALAASIALW
jgi:uncharacterized membrane protein YhhN